MVRLRGSSSLTGAAYESSREKAVADESVPQSVDWTTLLGEEDKYLYDGQAEITQEIDSRLDNATSLDSKVDTLIALLHQQIKNVARSDLFVLCTLVYATQLGVREQVLATIREETLQACVVRAQSKRLKLTNNAASFLKQRWGDWHDVCLITKEFSESIVQELARLCKLGVSKNDAKDRLRRHIYNRRVGKTPGVAKSPKLQKMDVTAAIAEVKFERVRDVGSIQPSKKRELSMKDTAYHPSGKKARTETEHPLGGFASNAAHDTSNSRQPDTMSNPGHANDQRPINDDEVEPEVEVGRGAVRNLSEGFDSSQSYSTFDSTFDQDGRSTPLDCHDTAPTSPPPASAKTKMEIVPDLPAHVTKAWEGAGPYHEQAVISLIDSYEEAPSPRSSTTSNISEEMLRDIKDVKKRLGTEVLVSALSQYFSSCIDVWLVDSNDLAKWDKASHWNNDAQKPPAVRPRSKPTTSRQMRIQSARTFILPFHHPDCLHWSLFVASRDESPGCWILDHYDSLPQIGPDPCERSRKAEKIVRSYLGWLLPESVESTRYMRKQCATQMDDVSCGIYLLSNADAISRKCAVPTIIDPRSFRQELYRLLRLKVDGSGVKNVPSSGPDCQIVSSKAEHPINTSSFPDELTNQAISKACLRLDRSVSYQISEASSKQPRVAPSHDRDPNNMSHSPEDQPTITPSWNSIIVQKPVAPLSIRLSLTRLADLHQTLLSEIEEQVQNLRETLSLSKKVLQETISTSTQCEEECSSWSREVDQAIKDLRAMRKNVATVTQMQWEPVSQRAKNDYKEKWLAEAQLEEENAEKEKDKCERRLHAVIAERETMILRSRTARTKVDKEEEMEQKLRTYLSMVLVASKMLS